MSSDEKPNVVTDEPVAEAAAAPDAGATAEATAPPAQPPSAPSSSEGGAGSAKEESGDAASVQSSVRGSEGEEKASTGAGEEASQAKNRDGDAAEPTDAGAEAKGGESGDGETKDGDEKKKEGDAEEDDEEKGEEAEEEEDEEERAASPTSDSDARVASQGSLLGDGSSVGGDDAGVTSRAFRGEFLGRNEYLTTPWVPPSVERARRHRAARMFGSGKASVCSTSQRDLNRMGVGIALYMQLQRYLCVLMTVMAVVALPGLLVSYKGSSVTEDEADGLGVAYTTLANLGFVDEGTVVTTNGTTVVTGCDEGFGINCNTTLVKIWDDWTMDARDASLIWTATDLLNALLMLLFILFWRRHVNAMSEAIDRSNLTPSDFAVFVTGLPTDATEEEVRKHFSGLFSLENDWSFRGFCGCCCRKRRRPSPKIYRPAAAEPTDVEKSSDAAKWAGFEDPWVAQVSIARPVGKRIRRYVKARSLVSKLKRARAKVKMYKEDTPHPDGADKARQEAAQREVDALQARVDRVHARIEAATARRASVALAAYVVFNHRESVRRCMQDYAGADRWFWRWVQAPPLRLRRRHRLQVRGAPEPSNILWENLETSSRNRCMRRTVTALVMLLLLALSFALIFVAQQRKTEFQDRTASLSLCNDLPAVFFGGYAQAKDAGGGSNPKLERNRTLDAGCAADNFHLTYQGASQSVADAAVTSYNISARCVDPCVPSSFDGSVVCRTLACVDTSYQSFGYECQSYELGARVACYCKATLIDRITQKGLISGARDLLDNEVDICGDFARDFLLANSLALAASMAIVAVNFALKTILKALSRFERHHSVSSEARAITTKVFIAQFINTGLLILLVFGRLPNDQKLPVLQDMGVMDGEIDSFNKDWYLQVGANIVLTMIINTLAPHVPPCSRYCCRERLRRRRSKVRKAVTQEQLDSLYTGPVFTIGPRYAVMLNVFFVCFLYAPGIPVLYMVGAASFLLGYWLDKLFLLRLYRRPPQYDEVLAKLAGSLLPWALVLHLMFACWMYGENTLLKSDVIDASLLSDFGVDSGGDSSQNLDQAYEDFVRDSEDWDKLGVTPRLIRTNVFPLALLLVLLIIITLVRLTAWRLVKNVLIRVKRCLLCQCCRRRRARIGPEDDELRERRELERELGVKLSRHVTVVAVPGYNDIFFQRLPKGKRRLSHRKKAAGWTVQLGTEGTALLFKTWLDSGVSNGCFHEAGQRKRTWEVVADEGLHSYRLEDNAEYMAALAAREEREAAEAAELAEATKSAGVAPLGAAGGAKAKAEDTRSAQRVGAKRNQVAPVDDGGDEAKAAAPPSGGKAQGNGGADAKAE